jgi:hypothetical protein
MRDGAPNGYAIVTFDGRRASLSFKAAGMPASKQMNVILPTQLTASSTSTNWVYVNVFDGSERSTVEYRLDGRGSWNRLEKVKEHDPSYLARKAAEELQPPTIPPYRKMGNPILSPHLWKARLPALAAGEHRIEVRTRDHQRRVHREENPFTVAP